MKLPPIARKLITRLMTSYFRYLVWSVVGVVLLLGLLMVIKPQFENVRLVGVLALEEKKQQLKDRTTYYDKVKAMVEKYRSLSGEETEKISRILPSRPEVSDLFHSLESLATASGMTLESVAVTKGSSAAAAAQPSGAASARREATAGAQNRTASSDTVQFLDVNLSVSGPTDYATYKRLLQNIEKSQRLFDVGSIAYKPSETKVQLAGEESATGNTITITFKTYYLEPAGSSPS